MDPPLPAITDRADIIEDTLVILKPDSLSLLPETLAFYKRAGLEVVDMKVVTPTDGQVAVHYVAHAGQPYMTNLLNYMISGPIIVMLIQGADAIRVVRLLHGDTDPNLAEAGTWRHMYGRSKEQNGIHVSGNKADARRETVIWFPGRNFRTAADNNDSERGVSTMARPTTRADVIEGIFTIIETIQGHEMAAVARFLGEEMTLDARKALTLNEADATLKLAEESFGITVLLRELDALTSVREAADLICERLGITS